MSFCDEIDGKRRCSSTACCGNSCASGKSSCEVCISSCNWQNNVGCLAHDACSGLRPTGSAATGACPGPCQCAEEKIWNSNMPPKPNCRWLNNFAELRRQWSDYGRRQVYGKCRDCSRPCRTVASCRPCLSPTPPCSGTILLTSDCQKCYGSRRLAGGASKSEMAPADKSSSPESLKREAGGGCPTPNCHPSTRYNSPDTDCASSTASSCCPSQCGYSQASSHRASDCQPCPLKSILKKRSCCQCNASRSCLCQPMPRGCNCPPPIQVDARAAHECSCDCPSTPECACPPSERRLPKATVKCPNARLCCPSPRLPPGPKYYCPRCQPCPPPPCGPSTSSKCRRPLPLKDLCSPCPSCPPCRPPTPCRKLTFCTERGGRPFSPCTETDVYCTLCCDQRTNVTRGVVHPVGISYTSEGTLNAYVQTNEKKSSSACCNVFFNLGGIGYSTLVPSYPLTLISFVLLILVAVTWSFGSAFYRRCLIRKRNICWKYLSL